MLGPRAARRRARSPERGLRPERIDAATHLPPVTSKSPLTYKATGVDIDAKEGALARAKQAIRSTFTPGVLGDVGSFGGLFDLAPVGCAGHVLVASADGVGTKLDVARRAGRYDTVGHDIVNHCVNDILVQGARPLFFLDYVGTGKLDGAVFAALVDGLAAACRAHGIALLGGETAEMPGVYAPGDVDLVGFIIGAVERSKILDGSRVRPGQVLIGLASSGLHTNGYSLARRVFFDVLEHDIEDRPEELRGASVGEALLAPHRSYLAPLWPLLERGKIAAMAHITGGGMQGNVPRVLKGKSPCDAVVDRASWPVPPLFQLLLHAGGVDREDAYRAFNMGIGMVLMVEPSDVDEVRADLRARGEESWVIGALEAGRGAVRWA
jgi:phosphoribosylformylglycinamidine cyclo-ligase